MIKKFAFSFNELEIDHQLMSEVMGYPDGLLPEPFNHYMETALKDAGILNDILSTYTVIDKVEIDENRRIIVAGGVEFKVGKIVCRELRESGRIAFFVCTAGKIISEKSEKLLKGEDPVLGYVYDILGSAIAEAAGDRMQSILKSELQITGEAITNRYSPGYCNWSVADQHKLFSFFDEAPCGVTLTPSSLMHPIKSISGIIGIGQNVKYRDYQCTLCSSPNCVYKKIRSR